MFTLIIDNFVSGKKEDYCFLNLENAINKFENELENNFPDVVLYIFHGNELIMMKSIKN